MTEYAPARWRAAGACVSADPDLFFPISATGKAVAQIAEAQRICGRCQVRRQCLDFAMDTGATAGIWGGTTPEERIRARREKTARREPRAEVA
jgi:WhiB family redox-sensing transcriptional regulator